MATPPVLYKYIKLEFALSALRDPKLKLTPPVEFHDPFEFLITLDRRRSLRKVGKLLDRNRSIRQLHDAARQCGLFSGDLKAFRRHYKANREKTIRQAARFAERQVSYYLHRQFLSDISKLYAVLCLTEVRDSNLMWAHHASGHKGIVLGIEIPANWQMHDVEYREDRLAIELAGNPSEEQRLDFSRALIKRKSRDWAYEHEWRALSQLNHLEKVILEGKALYFARLRPDLVKEVILGWRFPDEQVAELKQICSQNFPTAQLLKAIPHESEFAMAICDLRREELNAFPSAWAIPPQDLSRE